jgi:hypothetical protein
MKYNQSLGLCLCPSALIYSSSSRIYNNIREREFGKVFFMVKETGAGAYSYF